MVASHRVKCVRNDIAAIAFGALLLGAADSWAGDEYVESREIRPIGVYVHVLGEPFPSIFGVHHGLNLLRFLRLNAGYGMTRDLKTMLIGGGAKLLLPGFNLSPFLGLNGARLNNSDAKISTGSLQNTNLVYAGVGLDWQTSFGLNLSFGFNYSFTVGAGLPFFGFGWFFPLGAIPKRAHEEKLWPKNWSFI